MSRRSRKKIRSAHLKVKQMATQMKCRSSQNNDKSTRHCYVNGCDSSDNPNGVSKMLFHMPAALSRRRLWMTAIGKRGCRDRSNTISVCEDHFDLQKDVTYCKLTQMFVLKTDAVPRKNVPARAASKPSESNEDSQPCQATESEASNDGGTHDVETNHSDDRPIDGKQIVGCVAEKTSEECPVATSNANLNLVEDLVKGATTKSPVKVVKKTSAPQQCPNIKMTDEQRKRFLRTVRRLKIEPKVFVQNFWRIVRRNSRLRKMRCLTNSFRRRKRKKLRSPAPSDSPTPSRNRVRGALITNIFKRIGFFSTLRRSLVPRQTHKAMRTQRNATRAPPIVSDNIIEIDDDEADNAGGRSQRNDASVLEVAASSGLVAVNTKLRPDDADKTVDELRPFKDIEHLQGSYDVAAEDKSSKTVSPTKVNCTAMAVNVVAAASSVEEVNKQLREQLNLLQMGKRRLSMFVERSSYAYARRSDDFCAPNDNRSGAPFQPSQSSIENGEPSVTPDKIKNTQTNIQSQISELSPPPPPLTPPTTTTASPSPTKTTTTTETASPPTTTTASLPAEGKRNFIDALISKLNLKQSPIGLEKCVTTTASSIVAVSPSSKASTERLDLSNSINMDDSDDSTSSNTDFFGFPATESSVPGLTTTVAALKTMSSDNRSVFVSTELDRFMKDNALENAANVALPAKKTRDEAMMYAEAKPPTLVCPQRPVHMEKARTVAEKRLLLEQQTDVKVLMIENEMTVSRELTKRNRTNNNRVNETILNSVQMSAIPFTRDCWRLTSWLRTENGHFYYQTFRTESGDHIKIFSGRGNFKRKVIYDLPKLSKRGVIRSARCRGKCTRIDNIKVNNIEVLLRSQWPATTHAIPNKACITTISTNGKCIEAPLTPKKLNTLADMYCPTSRKAAPLSHKLLHSQRLSFDLDLGPLQLYRLPSVQLQVWPKLNRPLPDHIRPYLKSAITYRCLSAEWAAFAVSTLVAPPKLKRRGRPTLNYKKKTVPAVAGPPYTFDIPYCNNQRSVMVRKRKHCVRYQDVPLVGHSPPLQLNDVCTFANGIDRSDAVAVDVADALGAMIDSVAVSMIEEAFATHDPDAIVNRRDSLTLLAPTAADDVKRRLSSKLVNELKRLNATIINECAAPAKKNCGKDYCRLGCLCDSLSVPKTFAYHCKLLDCMFECLCPSKDIANEFESRGHNRDMQQLRDRATACLAKEEKEFTATVVVSKDNTIYIPNSEYTRKRNKRLPKRLDDCVRWNDHGGHSPGKKSEASIADQPLDEPMQVPDVSPIKKQQLSQQKLLEQMRHVNVPIVKLPHLEQFEPWCMVHNLYKCFCNLNAIEGEPFQFSKEKLVAAGMDLISSSEIDYVPVAKKRQYTFETANEDEMKQQRHDAWLPKKRAAKQPPIQSVPVSPSPPPALELEIYSAARVRCVDTQTQKLRNSKNARKLHSQVSHEERQNPGTLVLLNNRIRHCSMFANEKLYTLPERNAQQLPMQTKNLTIVEKARANTDSLLKSNNSETPASTTPSSLSPPPPVPSPTTSHPLISKQPVSNWNQHLIGTEPITPQQRRNIDHLNYWVNRVMDQITSHQKKAKTLAEPVHKLLTTMQWCHFADLFNGDRIYVWEVQLENKDIMLAVTIKNIMPSVEKAICVINIKAVMPERLPVLAKLLRMGKLPAKSSRLAVLLCGYTNYWNIIGAMTSDVDYMEQRVHVRPTPATHPLLAAKISRVYDLLVSIQKKKGGGDFKEAASLLTKATPLIVPDKTDISLASNIPIVKLTPQDLSTMQVPIPVMGAHRWFMLTIVDDFTHLFIPSWKNYLRFGQIKGGLANAAQQQRTVKISTQSPPHVYMAHTYTDKIFIGPYGVDDIFDLALYRMVGTILTRLDPTTETNSGQRARTTGCWLYMNDDVAIVRECHLDESVTKTTTTTAADNVDRPLAVASVTVNSAASMLEPSEIKEEDPDDCVIIENDTEPENEKQSAPLAPNVSPDKEESQVAVQNLLTKEMPALKPITPKKLDPLPRIAFVTSQNCVPKAVLLQTKLPTLQTQPPSPQKVVGPQTSKQLPRLTPAPSTVVSIESLRTNAPQFVSLASLVTAKTNISKIPPPPPTMTAAPLKLAPIENLLSPNHIAQTTTSAHQSSLLRSSLQKPSKELPPPPVSLFPYARKSLVQPKVVTLLNNTVATANKRISLDPPMTAHVPKRRAIDLDASIINQVQQVRPTISITSLPLANNAVPPTTSSTSLVTAAPKAAKIGSRRRFTIADVDCIKTTTATSFPKGITVTLNSNKVPSTPWTSQIVSIAQSTSIISIPPAPRSATGSSGITTNFVAAKKPGSSAKLSSASTTTVTSTTVPCVTAKSIITSALQKSNALAGTATLAKPIVGLITTKPLSLNPIKVANVTVQAKPMPTTNVKVNAPIKQRRASIGCQKPANANGSVMPAKVAHPHIVALLKSQPQQAQLTGKKLRPKIRLSSLSSPPSVPAVAGPSRATNKIRQPPPPSSKHVETIELDSDASDNDDNMVHNAENRDDDDGAAAEKGNETPSLSLEHLAVLTAQKVLQSQQKVSASPVYVVRGHLISNVLGLGKIEAGLMSDGISMKLCHMQDKCMFKNLQHTNDYLDVFVRRYSYAYEPRNLIITWRFVPEYRDASMVEEYRLQQRSMFTPSTVVLANRLVDLQSNFDIDTDLSSDTIGRLRLLRLAYMCVKKSEIRTISDLGIVDKATATIKEVVELENVNQQKAIAYAYKIHMKKRRLKEMRAALCIGQQPDIDQSIDNDDEVFVMAAASGSSKTNDAIAAIVAAVGDIITIDDDEC